MLINLAQLHIFKSSQPDIKIIIWKIYDEFSLCDGQIRINFYASLHTYVMDVICGLEFVCLQKYYIEKCPIHQIQKHSVNHQKRIFLYYSFYLCMVTWDWWYAKILMINSTNFIGTITNFYYNSFWCEVFKVGMRIILCKY